MSTPGVSTRLGPGEFERELDALPADMGGDMALMCVMVTMRRRGGDSALSRGDTAWTKLWDAGTNLFSRRLRAPMLSDLYALNSLGRQSYLDTWGSSRGPPNTMKHTMRLPMASRYRLLHIYTCLLRVHASTSPTKVPHRPDFSLAAVGHACCRDDDPWSRFWYVPAAES